MPTLPSGLQWKTNGMKVLRVYLGDPDFKKQNWEDVVAKVCVCSFPALNVAPVMWSGSGRRIGASS